MPKALNVVEEVLDNPSHRDRFRAAAPNVYQHVSKERKREATERIGEALLRG